MSFLGKIFKGITKIFKPIAKPLLIYYVARKLFHKKKKAPTPSPRQMPITQPLPQRPTIINYYYQRPVVPLPPVPAAPVTSQMYSLLSKYISNLRQVANNLANERAEQIRDVMGARGLLRSGWTAKMLGSVPADVWGELAPQLSTVIGQVGNALASDWYSNYLKNLSNWQANLRWW